MTNLRSDTPAQTVVYGIGAQKSGTTWLHMQLSRLAEARAPKPKELHYWDVIRAPHLEQFRLRAYDRYYQSQPHSILGHIKAWASPASRRNHVQALRYAGIFGGAPNDHSKYLEYLGIGSGARLLMDITPSYALLGRESFQEMTQQHSDVRFVFIMRDPIDRLWSGVSQRYRNLR